MTEKSLAVMGFEMCEAAGEGGLEGLKGAGSFVTQVALEFGEGHFDGIEVGAVRRKEAQPRSPGFDQLSHGRSLVDAEVVHNDVVSLVELRAEHLADVGCKYLPVGGALDQERSVDAVVAQGRDEGRGGPMTVGYRSDTAPPPQTPAA